MAGALAQHQAALDEIERARDQRDYALAYELDKVRADCERRIDWFKEMLGL